jgi:hypothetical protein
VFLEWSPHISVGDIWENGDTFIIYTLRQIKLGSRNLVGVMTLRIEYKTFVGKSEVNRPLGRYNNRLEVKGKIVPMLN